MCRELAAAAFSLITEGRLSAGHPMPSGGTKRG